MAAGAAAMAAVSSCRECRHFDNSAASLEAALPGLTSLSSAYAAVRANDGLCAFHARYVAATSICAAAIASGHS